MHSVLSITIKMDRGKKLVRENKDDFDTQAVYSKLYDFHTTSAGARVNKYGMLNHIISAKFEAWKGTT